VGAFVISLGRMKGRLLKIFSRRTIVVELEGVRKGGRENLGSLELFIPMKFKYEPPGHTCF